MKTPMRYTTRCASAVLVLLAISLGSAPARSQGEVAPNPVSEAAALRWSLLGTILPVATGAGLAARGPTDEAGVMVPLVLIGTGAIVGPSFGHFYAGRHLRGATSAGLRAMAAVATVWLSLGPCPLFEEDCSPSQKTAAATFLLAGTGLVVALAIYDIVTAPASVRKSNQAMGALGLTPYVSADGRTVGLLANLRF